MNVGIYDYNGNVVELPYFQLLQFKHAINLERQGLRHSRGSVTAHVRRLLHCPPRYSRDKLYSHLDAALKDIQDQLASAKEVRHDS